jgi:hypothetical protein
MKLSDDSPVKGLVYFKNKILEAEAIQLVHNLSHERHSNGIDIVFAGRWLSELQA